MNAPDAGTIKEFLANEEDTVIVGQDLLKMELGGASEGSEKQEAGQEPKAPAPGDQPMSSDPKPSKSDPKPKQEYSSSPPSPPPVLEKEDAPQPKQESKPDPPKAPPSQESSPKSTDFKRREPKSASGEAVYGSREERRVRVQWPPSIVWQLTIF